MVRLDGLRAESMDDAAELFADRRARKEFGHRGRCSKCAQRASSPDGGFAEFCAIIGRSGGRSEPTSRKVRFIVYREGADQIPRLVIRRRGWAAPDQQQLSPTTPQEPRLLHVAGAFLSLMILIDMRICETSTLTGAL